jgi:hypothetical protein
MAECVGAAVGGPVDMDSNTGVGTGVGAAVVSAAFDCGTLNGAFV